MHYANDTSIWVACSIIESLMKKNKQMYMKKQIYDVDVTSDELHCYATWKI